MISGFSSKRERIILAAVVALGAALAVQRGVYFPLKEWREALDARIERASGQLKKSAKVLRLNEAYEKKYAAFLETYRQTGTDEQAMSALLSDIDRATQGADVQVLEMKPRKGRRSGPANEFRIDVSLEGALKGILSYIHQLQIQPHLFHVEEFKIDRKAMNSNVLRCRVVLKRVLIQP